MSSQKTRKAAPSVDKWLKEAKSDPESEVTLITVITEAVKEENIKERIKKIMDKEARYFKDRGIEIKKE